MSLKKIDRKISLDLYISAFVISLIIFGIGIWFGLQIEQSTTNQVAETIDKTTGKLASISNLLLLENDPSFCLYLKEEMNKFDEETYTLGRQIGFMEEKRGIEDSLKNKYMELELRDYLLSKIINERCNLNQNIILYFVSSSECQDCKKFGEEISNARQKANIRVYTFDIDIKTGLTQSLVTKYGITSVPTIVLNEIKHEGFRSSDQIISLINTQ